MICKICKKENKEIFKAQVLNKYEVKYFKCDFCGFISTEEPYWLDEAYNSPINKEDTGIMSRNIMSSYQATNIIYYCFNKNKIFLDYAGGYGIFVRLMRDIGFDFKWKDNFATDLLSRGFEYSQKDKEIEMVTAFEVFEHFVDPISEIENILKISKNILFSTTLLPNDIPDKEEWWYYAFNHGQHVSFYARKTIEFIAHKYSLNYYTNGKSLHLLTIKKINPILFRLFTSKKTFLFFYILARLNLKSKIWSDHLLIK